MTLHQIGAAQNSRSHVPDSRRADRHHDHATRGQNRSSGRGDDDSQLSVRQTDELQISDASSSLVVTSNSRLRIRQSDDGAIKVNYKSKLKFDYEFQSEDGTTIKLSAKIKTRISYKQSGEESLEFKSRVKFQLSATLESVQSGAAPALGSKNVSDEQIAGIATALQQFSEILDQLGSAFQDDALGGDDLIASIVDAFNELTGSVQSNLPSDVETPIAPPVLPPTEPTAEETESQTPVVAADDSVAVADATTIADEVPSELEVAADDQPIDDAAVAETVQETTDDALQNVDNAADAETPQVTNSFPSRTVLVDLRLKFVQSISQLTSVLDSPSDQAGTPSTNTNILQHTKLDVRLSAYSQSQAYGETLPGYLVDSQA